MSENQLDADLNETYVSLQRSRGCSKCVKNISHLPRMTTSDELEEKEIKDSRRPVGRPSFRSFDLRSKYSLKNNNQASSDSETSFTLNSKPAQLRTELYTRSWMAAVLFNRVNLRINLICLAQFNVNEQHGHHSYEASSV